MKQLESIGIKKDSIFKSYLSPGRHKESYQWSEKKTWRFISKFPFIEFYKEKGFEIWCSHGMDSWYYEYVSLDYLKDQVKDRRDETLKIISDTEIEIWKNSYVNFSYTVGKNYKSSTQYFDTFKEAKEFYNELVRICGGMVQIEMQEDGTPKLIE